LPSVWHIPRLPFLEYLESPYPSGGDTGLVALGIPQLA